jgi:hypothetical protein
MRMNCLDDVVVISSSGLLITGYLISRSFWCHQSDSAGRLRAGASHGIGMHLGEAIEREHELRVSG